MQGFQNTARTIELMHCHFTNVAKVQKAEAHIYMCCQEVCKWVVRVIFKVKLPQQKEIGELLYYHRAHEISLRALYHV